MILVAVAGILIIFGILWEAFETVVLPRRVTRRFRFTVLFYRVTWRPWRGIARTIKGVKFRETILGYFGPLSLLSLFVVYAIFLVFGFGLLYFGAAHGTQTEWPLWEAMYLSGTTFFTLGIGDVTPHTSLERFLTVTESGLGFGFLALVLSYLPVIYQAFSRREVSVVLLDARAGSPPTGTELLRRHCGPHGLDALQQLLHEWEHSAAEILESHISYPVVSYFRSQHNNESWLAALAAILDATSLLVSSVDNPCSRQARLTFAMCRHTVVDLAQVFHTTQLDAMVDRLPAVDRVRMHKVLTEAGFQLVDTPASRAKLAELRGMYEPYLQALAVFLYVEIPPWILAKEITDNWRTTAWGRITGFTTPVKEEGGAPDDHDM
jgi:hypothetical protein